MCCSNQEGENLTKYGASLGNFIEVPNKKRGHFDKKASLVGLRLSAFTKSPNTKYEAAFFVPLLVE